MAHRYTGADTRTYPAYLDAATRLTLVAEPGGVYEIAAAGDDADLPVPPGDGRWRTEPPAKNSKKEA